MKRGALEKTGSGPGGLAKREALPRVSRTVSGLRLFVCAAALAVIAGCTEKLVRSDSKFFKSTQSNACFVQANDDSSGVDLEALAPKYVPVAVYRLRSPKGSPNPTTVFDADRLLTLANQYFTGANVQFYPAEIKYVDVDIPTDMVSVYPSEDIQDQIVSKVPEDSDGMLRLFVLDEDPLASAVGIDDGTDDSYDPEHLPTKKVVGFWSGRLGAIFIKPSVKSHQLAHELGHGFGLLHTFNTADICPADLTDDCLSDTSFDPGPMDPIHETCSFDDESCVYECIDGTKIDVLNIMSYYFERGFDDDCGMEFSPQQNEYMRCMVDMSDMASMAEFVPSDPLGWAEESTYDLACDLGKDEFDAVFSDALENGPNVEFRLCGDNSGSNMEFVPGGNMYYSGSTVKFKGVESGTSLSLDGGVYKGHDSPFGGEVAPDIEFENLLLRTTSSVALDLKGHASIGLRDVVLDTGETGNTVINLEDSGTVEIDKVRVSGRSRITTLANVMNGSAVSGNGLDVEKVTGNGTYGDVVSIFVVNAVEDRAPATFDVTNLSLNNTLSVVVGDGTQKPGQYTISGGTVDSITCDSSTSSCVVE